MKGKKIWGYILLQGLISAHKLHTHKQLTLQVWNYLYATFFSLSLSLLDRLILYSDLNQGQIKLVGNIIPRHNDLPCWENHENYPPNTGCTSCWSSHKTDTLFFCYSLKVFRVNSIALLCRQGPIIWLIRQRNDVLDTQGKEVGLLHGTDLEQIIVEGF